MRISVFSFYRMDPSENEGFKVSSSDGIWKREIDSPCPPSGSRQGWRGLNTNVR